MDAPLEMNLPIWVEFRGGESTVVCVQPHSVVRVDGDNERSAIWLAQSGVPPVRVEVMHGHREVRQRIDRAIADRVDDIKRAMRQGGSMLTVPSPRLA